MSASSRTPPEIAHSHYCPIAGFPALDSTMRSGRTILLSVLGRTVTMKPISVSLLASFLIAPLMLAFVPASAAFAQEEDRPTPLQIVALDECDPTTFNAVLGPDFCKNV